MTYDEVCDLLGIIATYDHRKIGDADGEAWEATIGDLAFPDARQAVVTHFRESTEWLMPAHVRQGVAAIRQARLDAAGPIAIPEELADYPIRAREFLQRAQDAIADGVPPAKAIGSGT